MKAKDDITLSKVIPFGVRGKTQGTAHIYLIHWGIRRFMPRGKRIGHQGEDQ